MRYRASTEKTVALDLRAFAAYLDHKDVPVAMKKDAAKWLNTKLDELLGDDAFGTEGQCDPRGDHRD